MTVWLSQHHTTIDWSVLSSNTIDRFSIQYCSNKGRSRTTTIFSIQKYSRNQPNYCGFLQRGRIIGGISGGKNRSDWNIFRIRKPAIGLAPSCPWELLINFDKRQPSRLFWAVVSEFFMMSYLQTTELLYRISIPVPLTLIDSYHFIKIGELYFHLLLVWVIK